MARERLRVSIWVKALVLAHVFAITVFSLPRPPNAMQTGLVRFEWPREVREVPEFLGTLPDWFLYFAYNNLRAPDLTGLPVLRDEPWVNTPIVIEGPIQYFLLRLGTWQYWDMFAPNPADTDVWMDAVVTFEDGTVTEGNFPRIYTLSMPEKYLKERYRKFVERANLDEHAFLWPSIAERIALEQATDPNNLPVHVLLRRHTLTFRWPDKPAEETYRTVNLYEHEVDVQSLREGLGR